uniref:Uncharacterized protein n=1 Tax=Meloidogyne enterolobii TaxID=390850 RepID=A0A6V7XXV8_MELEN|nr:unnamed protein product [Meloidogyne enterolobii]
MTTKQYRPYYEKGRIMPGMETLPFGFREIPNDLGHPRQRQPEQPHNAEPQTRQIDDSILNLEDVQGSSNWTNRDYLTRYHQ